MNAKEMLQLPKIEIDPEKTKNLCKCRPICKGRRRVWNGKLQKTSAELLVDRKPEPECRRRWPEERAEGLCPLLRRSHRVVLKTIQPPPVIRLCTQPIDDVVDTTYIQAVELVKKLGLSSTHKSACGHCACGACCPCTPREYVPLDPDLRRLRPDMRAFDERVKGLANEPSKIMYDVDF